MQVADLQQFIDALAQPLRSAKASQKVLDDFAKIGRVLEPFKERTLDEFGEFLAMADDYVRNGTLPETAKRAPSRARGVSKAPKMSVDAAAQRVLALYERSADPSLDYAMIESEVQALKPLTIKQLSEVAEQVHITLSKGTKDQLLKAIASAIMDRKSAAQRTPYRSEGSNTPASPRIEEDATSHRAS